MEKKHQYNLWYFLIALGVILVFQSWWVESRTVERIPYSRFEALLNQGQIERVEVRENTIQGKLKTPVDGKQYFITQRVEPDIADRLANKGVEYTGGTESTFLRDILSWMLPVLFFFALWMFFFRKMAEKQGMGGLMNVGKSKAKVYVEKQTGVTFDDVAGQDEAKSELEEIVEFLQSPDKYGRLGARIPKGILLVGPPGTGKTLFARAIAGQAGVPFFSISGSEFVEMFVGVGAARVRDLFEQARKAKPCIIFIDELDALGRARGGPGGGMGGHDEKEQTLNQLLAELDGFDPREGIVLLAATNRPEVLDPALLRAGRFDRQVVVDRPDKQGRIAILKVHVKKVTLAPDVDLEHIAAITPGFTGADLENLVNEAALFATRRGGENVTEDDFNNAVERLIAGVEKRSRLLSDEERKVVAYHEMGHALVASAMQGADVVHKVSIIPRGIGALGYTMQRPTEDRFLISTRDLKNKMAVLMGGRAAEKLVLDEVSTGAADDLDKVTEIARQMVTRFGMTESVGQAVYQPQRQAFLGDNSFSVSPKEYSEQTAREIDMAVRKLVDEAFDMALETLKKRRKDLEKGAQLLLEKETLTPDEFPPLAPAKSRSGQAKQTKQTKDAKQDKQSKQAQQAKQTAK